MLLAGRAAGHGALIEPRSRNVLAFDKKYDVGKWVFTASDMPGDDGSPGSAFGITALNSQFLGLYQPDNLNAPVQKVCGGRNTKGPAEDNPFERPGGVVTPMAPGKTYKIKFCFSFLHPPGRLNAGLCKADRLQDCLKLTVKSATRAMPLKLANANGKSGDAYHVYPPPYDGPLFGGYARFQLDQAWVNARYPPCTLGNLVNGGLEVTLEAQIPNIECPRCVLAVSWETGSICKFRDSPHDWFRDKYDTDSSFHAYKDSGSCLNLNIPHFKLGDKCGVDRPRPWCWDEAHPEIFHNCADVSIRKNNNLPDGNGSFTPPASRGSGTEDDDQTATTIVVAGITAAAISCLLSTILVVSSR